MRRLKLILLVAVALLSLPIVRVTPTVLGAAQNFTLGNVSCTGSPQTVQIINQDNAPNPLDTLAIAVNPPTGGTPLPATRISILGNLTGAPNVNANATFSLQFGTGAATSIALNSTTIPNGATIAAVTPPYVIQSGSQVVLLSDSQSPNTVLATATCGQTVAATQRTFYVALTGSDTIGAGTTPNTLCSPSAPQFVPPQTAASPGPCATIQNALLYARDGDTILVDTGHYEICSTINVSKLVKITAGNSAGNTPVVLHSFNGGTVFHVTAIGAAPVTGPGSPAGGTGVGAAPAAPTLGAFSQFAQIDGFAIGGATNPGAAAIFLDSDAYTAVTNNVLGGDPLTNPQQTCDPATNLPKPNTAATGPIEIFGNAESILLNSSDHPFIANNDILGAAIFQFSPVLATGQVLTGFGIVTGECLGLGPDVSDSVTIINNLIARNVNAAIWLCSDGGGLHQIKANVVRNNGRGIVLRAIDDTTLDQNQITDDYQDAIVIYDASNNNTLSNNTIESNETPGAAGIRLGGFGAGLFPLATTLSGNTLLRNWVDVVITGARNTQLFGNTITADKNRTGILIQVGSQGAQAYTQPDGTFVGISGQTANKIISNGQCGATSGCAIRLDQGVTSNVDATGTFNPATAIPGPTPPPTTSSVSFNNFGLPPGADINTVLWHRPNDPTLGFINTGTNLIPASPVAGTTGVVATISPATPSPTPSPTPNAGM